MIDFKKLSPKQIGLAVVAVLVLMANSLFVVGQTQQAIVIEFGRPVKFKDGDKEVSYINTPGLKMKIPFIQDVVYFDNRILDFEATDKETFDSEKKTLTVNAFAKYRIIDPLAFYEKVTDIAGINSKLDKIFEASLRDTIGEVPLKAMLTDQRKEIMHKIQESVSTKAADFGVEIKDVRIVRADLPRENSEAIFKRMFADRNKEAREYRAQGKEQSKIIISTAMKEATIIKANAEKESQTIRGDGDALASRIFAEAFSKDTDFYQFYRTMQAYRRGIKKEDTRAMLSSDSEFMKYFWDSEGRASKH
jgi:membrane protease subunit HflC